MIIIFRRTDDKVAGPIFCNEYGLLILIAEFRKFI